ncbi:hypothetical protein HUT11_22180 [Streptomyces seoulensis]|nr:hypothetical protein HUT11_22180 [Streptomyces seoulensis]
MPGTVLLLAASPVGKGRLVDAASVLPVLAAVEPAVLSGAPTASVVELADPLEPQAVLTRLRAAAASPGPLTVYVAGQLQLDRKQRLPHLALARTTAATVRYTALPWHWLREELRLRAEGTTTVVADLRADAESWRQVCERPLDAGAHVALYGRVAPPPVRRRVAAPAYMKAVATILRSGHRPPPDQLHEQALMRLAGEEGEESGPGLVLTPHRPIPGHAAPGVVYGQVTVAAGAAPVPETARGPETVPVSGAVPVPDAGMGSVPGPAPGAGPGSVPVPGARSGSVLVAEAASGHPTVPGQAPGAPGTATSTSTSTDTSTGTSIGTGTNTSTDTGVAIVAQRAPGGDPHASIAAFVEAGRHGDADTLAARWEQAAVRTHGAASEDALHWSEVRADLAMFAGDAAGSCRGWLTVAATRLAMGQPADAPAVEAAVDRAHHQWGTLRDPARARELGAVLAELRGRVPGRRRGALDHVRRQLRQLQTQG